MPTVVTEAEVDIANQALSNIGISTQIQSFADQNEQAKVCGFWYPKARDYVLQHSPWDFAFTAQALASDSSVAPGQPGAPFGTPYAFPGWPYGYVYPNDCLQLVAVTTIAGQRLGPAFWSSYWWPYPSMNYALPKIPTKVVQSYANPGQRMILCDVQVSAGTPVYAMYIQAVTNTQLFTPMFNDALAWFMGWRIGLALRSADKAKVQYCQASWEKSRAEALAQVLNEQQQDLERDSPSVIARW